MPIHQASLRPCLDKEGWGKRQYHTKSKKSKSKYLEISGVLPAIILYLILSFRPRRIKCIRQAWCSSLKHQSRVGTFWVLILLCHCCLTSQMATSTSCNWLWQCGLENVMLIPSLCTSVWKLVCLPKNAVAISVLRFRRDAYILGELLQRFCWFLVIFCCSGIDHD